MRLRGERVYKFFIVYCGFKEFRYYMIFFYYILGWYKELLNGGKRFDFVYDIFCFYVGILVFRVGFFVLRGCLYGWGGLG